MAMTSTPKQREPKSGLEREILSLRDIVRALKRMDSDTDQIRVVNTAFAIVKSARSARTVVKLQTRRSIDWEDA